MNFVPATLSPTPNYWCTWSCQGYCLQTPERTVADIMADEGVEAITDGQRSALNEENIFRPHGWAQRFFPDCRGDLFLVFDDGWDLPRRDYRPYFGSLELDTYKFPSCAGTPAERLRNLNNLCRDAGWRGAGLWICAQEAPVYFPESAQGQAERDYWRTRLEWSHDAGIGYWKVDWGVKMYDLHWRQWLTELAREVAPDLVVEHSVMELETFTDFGVDWRLPPGKLDECGDALGFSEVLRTYDVLSQHSVATTLARVAQLCDIGRQTGGNGLLNCEDELYLGAALGCALGVMRYPLFNPQEPDYDLVFNGNRQTKRRVDEVTRALRWQRLAPAFGTAATEVRMDDIILYDTWTYRTGDTWCQAVIDKGSRQGAPARVARGLPLPEVRGGGEERPFVAASRHPNGAVAVAALPRTFDGRGWTSVEVDVTAQVPAATWPEHPERRAVVGIFGCYKSLTLDFATSLKDCTIWLQDLAGSQATKLDHAITIDDRRLTLPGGMIHREGCRAASPGDLSDPGLLLVIQ